MSTDKVAPSSRAFPRCLTKIWMMREQHTELIIVALYPSPVTPMGTKLCPGGKQPCQPNKHIKGWNKQYYATNQHTEDECLKKGEKKRGGTQGGEGDRKKRGVRGQGGGKGRRSHPKDLKHTYFIEYRS